MATKPGKFKNSMRLIVLSCAACMTSGVVQAYLSSQTTDVDAGCTKPQAGGPPDADAVAQCMKKAEEADPMMAGIREKATPCARGPSL